MNSGRVFDEPFVNVSNFLSVSRVLLLAPFTWLTFKYLDEPNDLFLTWLIVIAVLAALSDFLDGLLARLLQQETIVGRYLDPICDKIVIITAMTLLVIYFEFPVWIYIIYILREVGGVWMGTFLYFKRNQQGRPNLFGKIAVGFAGLMILWYYSVPNLRQSYPAGDWRLDPDISAWMFLIIHIIGMIGYVRSYGKIILQSAKPGKDS